MEGGCVLAKCILWVYRACRVSVLRPFLLSTCFFTVLPVPDVNSHLEGYWSRPCRRIILLSRIKYWSSLHPSGSTSPITTLGANDTAFQTVPSIPTASSLNIPPLIDPAEPPGTSLPPLLHSFLHTLLLLIEALTNTARNPGELKEKGWAHEGDQYIQHLTNLAATMMVSANQLRGVQASSCFTSWGESCRLRLFFTIGGSDVGATHAKTIISASGTDGYSENVRDAQSRSCFYV